jgi:hypothetical protein
MGHIASNGKLNSFNRAGAKAPLLNFEKNFGLHVNIAYKSQHCHYFRHFPQSMKSFTTEAEI